MRIFADDMKYETLWRRLTGIYDTDEAKAIVRLVLDDRFGLSLTDIVGGKVEELSPTACETLEANITGGRFFCDIADVTKEPSPCDIRARCGNGKRVYRDNAGTGDASSKSDGMGHLR